MICMCVGPSCISVLSVSFTRDKLRYYNLLLYNKYTVVYRVNKWLNLLNHGCRLLDLLGFLGVKL